MSKADDPEAANKLVQECIDAGHAIPVPLELMRERIDELERKGKIKVYEKSQGTFHMTCDNGETFDGKLSDDIPPKYKVMVGEDEPLLVLGKVGGPKAGMPMTADGDILIFAPHISDYGPEDKPKTSTSGRGSATFLDPQFSSRRPSLAQLMRRNSSMGQDSQSNDKGTISDRLETLLPEINKVGGREKGNEFSHHGPDTFNPWTDMDKNLPALIFAPSRVEGMAGVALARTPSGLKHLFQQIKNAQYQFFGNDEWEPDMVPRRESSAFNAFGDLPFPPPASRRGSAAFLNSRRGSEALFFLPEEKRTASPAPIFTNPNPFSSEGTHAPKGESSAKEENLFNNWTFPKSQNPDS